MFEKLRANSPELNEKKKWVEAFRKNHNMMENSSLGCRERFDFSRYQSYAAEAWWTLGW